MYNSITDFIRNDVKEIEGMIGNILKGTNDATDLTLDMPQIFRNHLQSYLGCAFHIRHVRLPHYFGHCR